MKRALVILAALGLLMSPLIVSQANAAPAKAKHHTVVKHHKKLLKKRARRHLARKQSRKAAV